MAMAQRRHFQTLEDMTDSVFKSTDTEDHPIDLSYTPSHAASQRPATEREYDRPTDHTQDGDGKGIAAPVQSASMPSIAISENVPVDHPEDEEEEEEGSHADTESEDAASSDYSSGTESEDDVEGTPGAVERTHVENSPSHVPYVHVSKEHLQSSDDMRDGQLRRSNVRFQQDHPSDGFHVAYTPTEYMHTPVANLRDLPTVPHRGHHMRNPSMGFPRQPPNKYNAHELDDNAERYYPESIPSSHTTYTPSHDIRHTDAHGQMEGSSAGMENAQLTKQLLNLKKTITTDTWPTTAVEFSDGISRDMAVIVDAFEELYEKATGIGLPISMLTNVLSSQSRLFTQNAIVNEIDYEVAMKSAYLNVHVFATILKEYQSLDVEKRRKLTNRASDMHRGDPQQAAPGNVSKNVPETLPAQIRQDDKEITRPTSVIMQGKKYRQVYVSDSDVTDVPDRMIRNPHSKGNATRSSTIGGMPVDVKPNPRRSQESTVSKPPPVQSSGVAQDDTSTYASGQTKSSHTGGGRMMQHAPRGQTMDGARSDAPGGSPGSASEDVDKEIYLAHSSPAKKGPENASGCLPF
jgi:hypothetical protein